MTPPQPLGPVLHSFFFFFFASHLITVKGLRPASVRSYRDTVRLFLVFARGVRIARRSSCVHISVLFAAKAWTRDHNGRCFTRWIRASVNASDARPAIPGHATTAARRYQRSIVLPWFPRYPVNSEYGLAPRILGGGPQLRDPFGVGALEPVPAQPALGVLVVQQVDEPVRRLLVVAFPPGDPGGEVLSEVPGGSFAAEQ